MCGEERSRLDVERYILRRRPLEEILFCPKYLPSFFAVILKPTTTRSKTDLFKSMGIHPTACSVYVYISGIYHNIYVSSYQFVPVARLRLFPSILVRATKVGPQHQPSTLASLLENAAIASTNSLRGKVLYALSACLSNNGDVQLQFGSMRGEAVLSAMYDADGSDSRVRTKTLTLMSDLLSEAARGSPAAVLGVMPVGTSSASGGAWCRRADERLQQASTLAHIEKAVEAVASFAPSCASQFKALGTKERLDGLAQQCRVSAQTGSAEEELEFHEELAHKLEECAVSLR